MLLCTYALIAMFHSVKGDLSFIALGDWGGTSDKHPTTKGQRLTSKGMRAIADHLGSNFTLLLGDNFYKHGLAGNKHKARKRFKKTFRQVYAHKMPDLIFYVVAGNHDYGNGQQAAVSAQLDYSKVDTQWHFPALWHKVHRKFTAGAETRTVDILLIDTVILCGDGAESEIFIDNQLRTLWPELNTSQGLIRRLVAEKQWAWLEQELKSSTADFLWVAGHYPVWSVGEHGPTECLIERLYPLLIRYSAHYMSGHDHMSEHFQHQGFNAFVVGAGMECCSPLVKHSHIPEGALKYFMAGPSGIISSRPVPFAVHGAFGSFRFTAEHASVTLHAHNGSELYTGPNIPRRKVDSSVHRLGLDLWQSAQNIPFRKVDSSLWRFGDHLWQARSVIAAISICLPVLGLGMYCQRRLNTGRARKGVAEALLEN